MPPSQFDTALLGRTFDPAGAINAGYLDRVVAADDVLESATVEAQALSKLSKGAVAHSKRLARQPLADAIAGRLAADMAATSGPRG
jgi:enoyl-CoA hydratase